MMYLITSDISPIFVCKAESRKEALHKFMDGMEPHTYRNITGHDSFLARELTLELLEEVTPDEFLISNSTDF